MPKTHDVSEYLLLAGRLSKRKGQYHRPSGGFAGYTTKTYN